MLEAFALDTSKQIGDGNMHVVKNEFGSLYPLVAEFFKGATDTQARSTLFNDEETHTAMRGMDVRIGASEYGKNAAMYAIGDPEFGAIEYIRIAIPYGDHRNGLYVAP